MLVWYCHLLKNFPHIVVIQRVKVFGIVNKEEIDVFLELSHFFDDPADVGNLISASSAFSKTNLNIWKFKYCSSTVQVRFKYCLSLAWRILSTMLLDCEMSATVW